jgi:hypothetical protein
LINATLAASRRASSYTALRSALNAIACSATTLMEFARPARYWGGFVLLVWRTGRAAAPATADPMRHFRNRR